MAFYTTTDNALDRWESGGHEYAIAVHDGDAQCPAGDFYSGANAARRVGDNSWWGDQSVPGRPDAARATVDYNGHKFEAVAIADNEEAEAVATMFAHWAEGDVYRIARDNQVVGEYYTSDGGQPTRTEVEQSGW